MDGGYSVNGKCAVSQSNDITNAVNAIRSASSLTETTFLEVGQTLESSIEILGELTSRFEAVLEDLEGEALSQALKALSATAVQVKALGHDQVNKSSRFDEMRRLTETIGGRITQMNASLRDVDCLAVNSRIAAASIRVPGNDFVSFADEIGRTLDFTRTTLDRFAAELRNVRQHVMTAHLGQLAFEKCQQEASRSITDRLSATVKSIALRNQHAARASLDVRLGSARVRQRICDAILALQIGDITRQRLEHANDALSLAAEMRSPSGAHDVVLDETEQRTFAMAVHRLQSAQLVDAAGNFDRDVRQITGSLRSLATEAQVLRKLGDAAYGSAKGGGGTFLQELEGQIAEALVLFEGFETARAEVANVTAMVSDASASLCGHLRTVRMMEDDIRIMGLNTTFKCARIGREGLALSIIAQELRSYADGFAKEAGALMGEVETVAGISSSLIGGTDVDRTQVLSDGTRTMRDSLATLRRMGQGLDLAMVDLERDSHRVEALLTTTVAKLEGQSDTGQVLREAAGNLGRSGPADFADLPPRVDQMLRLIARGYTMANERVVHDRIFGGSTAAAPEPVSELEDFLF
jgi:hypothetical protein